MANTYIVSGSQFKPYTFDEMIKPALMYKQAYEDTEKKLESLEELGIDENSFLEQDTASKELYNNYMTKLQETADALSNGYNAEVAKQARNLHKTFKTKINPMKTKIAVRAALTEQQRQAKLNNPYLIFDKDYANASLDDISENSTYDTLDLAKIGNEITKDMTKFIASKNPKFSQNDVEGIGTVLTTTYGWTPEDVKIELQNPNSELSQKLQEYKSKYYNNKFSNNQNYIDAFIENAVKSNAGVSESQFVKNNSSKGMTIDAAGNVFSETGVYQGRYNSDGSFTAKSGDGGNNDLFKALSGLDEDIIYTITNDGSVQEQSMDSNFLKNEDKGFISTGSYVTDIEELPESIKTMVKKYPSGSVSVKKWKHTSDSQGRYKLEKNYTGTGLQWDSSDYTPESDDLGSVVIKSGNKNKGNKEDSKNIS